MAGSHSIAPFPLDTDRQAFGHWLSGFTDGEGCFSLNWMHAPKRKKTYGSARFSINLRADDGDVLFLVQRFWQCGHIQHDPTRNKRSPNPHTSFHVHDLFDLSEIVVPHFNQFPLRAKKKHDFEIWKEAVHFMLQIRLRPVVNLPRKRNEFTGTSSR